MKLFFNLILVLACFYGALWLFPEPAPMDDIPFYSDSGFSVIAHRGGRGLVPGNTIEAAINAVNIGSDIIEVDVHLTADDVLVVRHDASIDTTTNGSGQISAMSLSEIQAYDAGFHEIDYPNTKYEKLIKVPTLGALFSELPNQRYLIELKPQDVSAADNLCGLIRQYKIQNQVMVGSFHTLMLKHFRGVCPEVPTSLGKSEIEKLVLLERLSLSHLFISEGYSIQIPFSAGGIDILRLKFIKVMHKRNIRVDAWTLNDIRSMQYAIDIGVDGVITDWPDILIKMQ